MNPSPETRQVAPSGQPIECLFERATAAHFSLPEALRVNYGGDFGLPEACLFANFVASLDGVVALPGDTESGQIISGKNTADRFVMGLLRACADAVLLGAGTFRKSGAHLWHPDRIYPAGAASFSALRQSFARPAPPLLVLLSDSGNLDVSQPALTGSWIFTTERGAATLRARLPASTRLTVLTTPHISLTDVVRTLRSEGFQRILTEGGPTLFAELVREQLVDELFLTTSPALFGRFVDDERKSLADGLDLSNTKLDLRAVRRHGSHLFLRYALERPLLTP